MRCDLRNRSTVRGTPISLFPFPGVARTSSDLNCTLKTALSISLVLVLHFDPTTQIRGTGWRVRHHAAISARAFVVWETDNRAALGHRRWSAAELTTAATAPASSA